MRLLTRTLHRAFPELDPFDDDQCSRFVKRARQGAGKKAVLVIGVLAVAIPLLAVGVWVTGIMYSRLRVELYWPAIVSSASFQWAGIAACSLGIGPVAGFIVRDRLLRRWVRIILTTQGQCPACGYNVLGLRLNEESAVQCPECGLKTVVDPSLGELVLDSHGRPIALGEARSVAKAGRSKGSKWVRRVLIAVAVLLFVVMPGVVGGYEMFIRGQAKRARAHLLTLDQATRDLIIMLQRAPAGPSAWVPLARAEKEMAGAEEELRILDASGLRAELYYLRLLKPRVRLEDEVAFRRGATALQGGAVGGRLRALQFLGQSKQRGVPEYLREASKRACTLPFDENGELLGPRSAGASGGRSSATDMMYPVGVGDLNAMMSMCMARMSLGAKSGDSDEVADAFESGLALVRISSEQPTHRFQWLYGSLMYQAGAVLTVHPDAGLVEMMKRAMTRQALAPQAKNTVESSRILWQNHVSEHFSDPAGARFGRYSAKFVKYLEQSLLGPRRLGTYEENMALVNDYHDALKLRLENGGELSGFAWASPVAVRGDLPGLVVSMPTGLAWQAQYNKQIKVAEAGLETIMSITEYRAAHGRLPESLREVARWQGAPLPLDPFSGKDLLYRALQSGRNGQVSMYRLLSVGPNGVVDAEEWGPPLAPSGAAADDLTIVDGYEIPW